jgi:hypothetical protein
MAVNYGLDSTQPKALEQVDATAGCLGNLGWLRRIPPATISRSGSVLVMACGLYSTAILSFQLGSSATEALLM